MATQLFLRDEVSDTHLATDNLNLLSIAVGWVSKALATTRGAGVIASDNVATVAGATAGITITKTSAVEWISPPLSADVTIAGTITGNIWASETNMSANVSICMVVEVIRANATATRNSNTIEEIARRAPGTEIAVTTRAANNFTMTPTSTVVNRGDRLRVRLFGDDVTGGVNMAATYTFNASWSGTGAAADGDTYVTFTEDFSFESAPAGSVLYLTNTASDVVTASTDREAWTSRGAGVTNAGDFTVNGWTAPISLAAVIPVDWFTKQLTAFTLSGMAVANLRLRETVATANASARLQIARVDSDGTNATVWGDWCIAPTGTDNGELPTTEAARTCYVSGDDLAFTNGQRLRFRAYMDDMSSGPMSATTTPEVRLVFAGTSGGANGDTYITLPQTVSEYVSSTPGPASMRRQRRASRYLTHR